MRITTLVLAVNPERVMARVDIALPSCEKAISVLPPSGVGVVPEEVDEASSEHAIKATSARAVNV